MANESATVSEASLAFEGPATLIFTRKIKPGREASYKAWVSGFQDASREVPGFLGASTMGRGGTENEYVSIVRFASFDHLRAWEESDLRQKWLARVPVGAVDGEAKVRRLEGLEFWFTAPGVATAVAPSPHKMVFVLSVIVFGLVTLLGPVIRIALGNAPLAIRSLAMVVVQVCLMTYVIMPRVTRWLAGWLFRR